jgi:hypothetical protein
VPKKAGEKKSVTKTPTKKATTGSGRR